MFMGIQRAGLPSAIVLLIIVLWVTTAGAETGVSDVLDRIPAESAAETENNNATLVRLGPAAIRSLCGMLVPIGAGDDSRVRYALHGLVMYAGRPGAEKERTMLTGALIDGLAAAVNGEVKAFLIRQLALVGKQDAVGAISPYVYDEELCEPATQALLAINTEGAVREIVRALPKVRGKSLLTIVQALGELRARQASKDLIRLAESDEPEVRSAALQALANIGEPDAEKLLAEAMETTSTFERAQAASRYLLYARRLAERGDTERCAAICRHLIETRTTPDDVNLRCAALGTLVETLGDRALSDLINAAGSPEHEIRGTAIGLAHRISGTKATARWIQKMDEVSPEIRAEIITMLGERGDNAAIPVIVEALTDDNESIRLAAIPAATRLGGIIVLGEILDALRTGSEQEIEVITRELMSLSGRQVTGVLAMQLPEMPLRQQVALHEVLAARGDTSQLDGVFTLAGNPDSSVSIAAMDVLGQMAGFDDLKRLVDILVAARDEEVRAAAERMVVSVTARIPDRDTFIPLFNGKDLTGWTGNTVSYVAEEGRIVLDPDRKSADSESSGNLYTAGLYSNFILRFEFKLTPGANNGLGIRTPLKGDAAYVGMELQILDNTADRHRDLQPYQYHGSIYGVVPAKRGYLKPVGEWNYEEVIALGRRIVVNLNGVLIVGADIDEASTPNTIDGRDHPGLKRTSGHIGFLGHGSPLEFRNIRLRELENSRE